MHGFATKRGKYIVSCITLEGTKVSSNILYKTVPFAALMMQRSPNLTTDKCHLTFGEATSTQCGCKGEIQRRCRHTLNLHGINVMGKCGRV
jgi:hypothetical protein